MKKQAKGPKFRARGPVSERFMRHHYGASGYVKKPLYSHELNERVNARISKFVVDAMAQWGWNAFGVYEVVKEELLREAGPARGRKRS